MKYRYNSISKIVLTALLVASTINCQHPFSIKTKYKNLKVVARITDKYNAVDVAAQEDRIGKREDIYAYDSNGDGKFDKIETRFPERSELEKYLPLDSLEKIYNIARDEYDLRKFIKTQRNLEKNVSEIAPGFFSDTLKQKYNVK